jgi:putative nucleotidyltransferase with HDIG domain
VRVLFVDDDPQILGSLERMAGEFGWEIITCDGGSKALALLETDRFDALVTDLQMPGVDGVAVLEAAHKHHPNMVRIVLSGHAELESAARAVPVAHQFLGKPVETARLHEMIERTVGLQALMQDEALRSTIGGIDQLPSVPRVYVTLNKVLANPASGAKEVADVVAHDTAMCAKVLQIANSSFYSGRFPISDIDQAVSRLGFQVIKNLAMVVAVFESCKLTRMVPGFSFEEFQSHAVAVGNLAARLLDERRQSADAYTAGMLHDIGKLVLAAKFPERLEHCARTAESSGRLFHEVELEAYGVTHAEIGGYLLGLWGLPHPVVEAVANHHQPQRVPATGVGVVSAVYLANSLLRDEPIDEAYLESINCRHLLDRWRGLSELPKAS